MLLNFHLASKMLIYFLILILLKDDLFTWHFTIRGMENTEFEGGFYHGVIKLPNSYPLKPPNLMFLNVIL